MQFWEDRYRKRGLEWGTQPSLAGRAAAEFLAEKQGKILDIGCGYGRDSIYLAKLGFDVVGIDVSKVALNIGENWRKKENLCNVKFHCAKMEDNIFEAHNFEAVVIYNVMQLFNEKNRLDFVAELKRILKPQGLLFQAVFSTKDNDFGKGEQIEKNSFSSGSGRLRHFFCREEIEELFSGFKILRLEEVVIPDQQVGRPPHFHNEWLMVLQKD